MEVFDFCGFMHNYSKINGNSNGNKFVTFKLCHFAQRIFPVSDRKAGIPEKNRFYFKF